MGSYLDKPETTKKSAYEENEFLEVGSSSMQGWRINQEDAHNSILNINGDNVSFFGLYDGHGGSEVAEYCSKHLPEFLKQLKTFKDKNYETALKEAFMGFDAVLLKEDVIEQLKQIAKNNPDYEDTDADDEETAEEVIDLHEEARMSLSEVLQKYKNKTESAKKTSEAGAVGATGGSSQNPTSSSSPSKKPAASSSSGGGEEEPAGVSSSENQVSSSSSAEQNPSPTSTQELVEKIDDNEPQSSSSAGEGSVQVNGQIGSSSSSSIANSSSSNAEAAAAAPESSAVATQKPTSAPKQKDKDDVSSEEDDDEDDDEHDKTYKENPKKKVPNSDESSEEENYSGDEDMDEEEVDDEEMSGEEEDDEDDHLDDAFMSSMETGPGKQSGCTAVVAVLDGRDLYVANAGDSRCVLCRNGKVVEMTADHKPEDTPEFERIRKAGGRVTLDGRVNGGLNLSRAIGDHGYKMNKDLPAEEQMITALPDLKKIVLQPEDEFMVLACDGIWNYMSNEEVIGFVKHRIDSKKPLTEICEELFDNCLAPNTLGDGTGCDNMTAIIVKFRDTIFKQPDSQTSACNSETENATRKRSLNIENDNEVQSSEQPSDKKQKIEDELAPSTVDTA